MKSSELNALSREDLEKKLNDLKEEHLRLRCNHATGQLQDVQQIKKQRREIARVKTFLNQKTVQAASNS
ncbi:MAG: 50S ribosomal protein L29 [bacterium]|jgi:large subunit ribosomal protein L29